MCVCIAVARVQGACKVERCGARIAFARVALARIAPWCLVHACVHALLVHALLLLASPSPSPARILHAKSRESRFLARKLFLMCFCRAKAFFCYAKAFLGVKNRPFAKGLK